MKSVFYNYKKSATCPFEFIGSVRCRWMPNNRTRVRESQTVSKSVGNGGRRYPGKMKFSTEGYMSAVIYDTYFFAAESRVFLDPKACGRRMWREGVCVDTKGDRAAWRTRVNKNVQYRVPPAGRLRNPIVYHLYLREDRTYM